MTRSKNAGSDGPTGPQPSVARFFQSVEDRTWTDAEKELDSIKQKVENTQWTRGYIKALEGLMLTYRSNDDTHLYLPKALTNRSDETIAGLRREFTGFSSDDLHGEYDRGYFKALEEYLSALKAQKQNQFSGQQTLQSVAAVEEEHAAPETRDEHRE